MRAPYTVRSTDITLRQVMRGHIILAAGYVLLPLFPTLLAGFGPALTFFAGSLFSIVLLLAQIRSISVLRSGGLEGPIRSTPLRPWFVIVLWLTGVGAIWASPALVSGADHTSAVHLAALATIAQVMALVFALAVSINLPRFLANQAEAKPQR